MSKTDREPSKSNPIHRIRVDLQHMKDGVIRMTGEDLFKILRYMYLARWRSNMDGYETGEYTYPGSRGPVFIEEVRPVSTRKKEVDAYNVTYTDSAGNERKIGTVVDTDSRYNPAGVGVFKTPTDRKPAFYTGSIDSSFTKDGQDIKRDLAGELLTALNYLHKPSRGQRTRPQRSSK